MTPGNSPFLGINMWLNCGRGAMGWTIACGSAQDMRTFFAPQACH